VAVEAEEDGVQEEDVDDYCCDGEGGHDVCSLGEDSMR
jgi:hypothetical protein